MCPRPANSRTAHPFELGGEELLETASLGDVVQLCKLLSDNPALLHYVDPDDRWTPLLAATANGSLEMVQLLVGLGAKVNQRDAYDRTPLYWAAAGKNIEVLRLLLRHGAAHKVMSSEGLSPLMVAARNGFVEGVAALVAHDSSAKHLKMWSRGGSTIGLALAAGHIEVVRLLVNHGVTVPFGAKMMDTESASTSNAILSCSTISTLSSSPPPSPPSTTTSVLSAPPPHSSCCQWWGFLLSRWRGAQ